MVRVLLEEAQAGSRSQPSSDDTPDHPLFTEPGHRAWKERTLERLRERRYGHR
jgi:hypothetical protein